MSLTTLQKDICRLIAQNRIEQGESYLAGAVPLNVFTESQRISRDIDLFHDTSEALAVTWQAVSNLAICYSIRAVSKERIRALSDNHCRPFITIIPADCRCNLFGY